MGSRSKSEIRRVAVLLDEVAELDAAAGDPSAIVHSTGSIIAALESRGYEPVIIELEIGRPREWLRRLIAEDFDIAFNLCESVAGSSAGEHLAAAAVELLDIPVTGARSSTLLHCLNKDRCNATLRIHGVPVPDWRLVEVKDGPPTDWGLFPAIVKPAAEDGSNGVHASSVVESPAELERAIEGLSMTWRRLLVQEFVQGREINLAIVGRYLLPPAEIDFSTLPEGSPHIVSYAAKWLTGSPEDLGTRPICPAPLSEPETEELHDLAVRVWRLMDGSGYGRIDVRLDADGAPTVIEVNPNPDLSPDAGLARQARAAGWAYDDLIERIIEIAADDGGESTGRREDYVRLDARLRQAGRV